MAGDRSPVMGEHQHVGGSGGQVGIQHPLLPST